ncbi:MAG: MerR family transcriptional regulator [Verrucomicrobiales bacterium]|nr:MerR family transcriptional regulator [Verrucomicrobiales bacterium]
MHSIRIVARRTGLSAHVIRIWEKRYRAVEPDRTATNRRLYSESDVERLSLLHAATASGHSIGLIAQLPTAHLRQLLSRSAAVAPAPCSEPPAPETLRNQCVAAIRDLDQHELERLLRGAALQHGTQGVLQKLVAPLATDVGRLWQQGEITAAHEHFASAVIRGFLTDLARPFALTPAAPMLVVGTPAGQIHELGAVIAAAAATAHGWRVTYLGPSLPACELASAALRTESRAVALSVVYPKDDPDLSRELEQLRSYLPARTAIIVGGRAAGAYARVLDRIGARIAVGIEDFYALLDQVRSGDGAPGQPERKPV